MKFIVMISIFFTLVLSDAPAVLCKDTSPALNVPAASLLTLDEIMERVEKRYAVSGFFARFTQASTLKALEITDTASGKVFVKRPGMMRWEYEKPDRQIIITDGKMLWIYRPEDNQVMLGKAPVFFGDGKGAGFLSDMKLVRRKFSIALEKKESANNYVLKLIPRKKTLGISVIYLSISKKTFNIVQIVTYNSYGDETRIELDDIQVKQNMENSGFTFKIPEGVDLLQLDDQIGEK